MGGFLKITGFPFVVSPGNQNATSWAYVKKMSLTSNHHLEGWIYGTNINYLTMSEHNGDTPSQLSASHANDDTSLTGSFFFTTTD